MERAVPHLRILDYAEAVAFYVDLLGFKIDFEWRHEPGFPVYMGIKRGDLYAHLSQHEGSGQPGNGRGMMLWVDDADEWYARIVAQNAKIEREISTRPWKTRDFSLLDPAGNSITIASATEEYRPGLQSHPTKS